MTGMGNPDLRWTTVCIDCADAERLADFYCRLLGWQVAARDGHGWVQVGDPAGGVGLNFQSEDWYRPPTWPEKPAEQTKMLHFEIRVDDMDAAVAHAAAAGATVAPHQPPDRDHGRLRVMLDPAGHPFCLFVEGE
jgi:catechol 2,3-dioxygenase-like lactoylglutathione lyase family enzyme